jgi:quinol monooxygenase YgiN
VVIVAIQVILELQAKPGEGDRLAEVVRGMLHDTNRMDGALGSEVLRGLDDGDKVVLVEQWRDRADHEAYVR